MVKHILNVGKCKNMQTPNLERSAKATGDLRLLLSVPFVIVAYLFISETVEISTTPHHSLIVSPKITTQHTNNNNNIRHKLTHFHIVFHSLR